MARNVMYYSQPELLSWDQPLDKPFAEADLPWQNWKKMEIKDIFK